MSGVKAIRRLSQERQEQEAAVEPVSDYAVAPSGEQYTDDGGRLLGHGWVEYFDPSSDHPFYVNEATNETVWEYPTELQEGVPETAGEPSTVVALFGAQPQTPEASARSGYSDDPAERTVVERKPNRFDALAHLADQDTDESSDDDDEERARRLGVAFASPRVVVELEEKDNSTDRPRELNSKSAAMLEKLQSTRAGGGGDIMENQAAFNNKGMLMLESIENKVDPTDEHEDDEEAIARLQNEKTKYQDVRAWQAMA